MIVPKQYENGLLTINVTEDDPSITAKWSGRSVERVPGVFLTPILVRLVNHAGDVDKRLVLDFKSLLYMNSSTITPIIKILERGKRGTAQITVRYDASKKWQDLSFSALTIFRTKDKRVDLQGE